MITLPPSDVDSHVMVDGYEVVIRNPGKVLGRDGGNITRADIVQYYLDIGDTLLGHLQGRRLTGVRYPDGVAGRGFFVKNAPATRPDWVAVVPAPHGETDGTYICVENLATVIWLASTDVLEVHVPHTTTDKPESADGIILDLDPGAGMDLVDVAHLAVLLWTELLGDRRVVCKTSGKSGLHLLLPVEGGLQVNEAVIAGREMAAEATKRWGDLVVDTPGKKQRVGRILIDWQQNQRHRTTAAPYTLRGGPTLGVSAPLQFDELRLLAERNLEILPNDIVGRIRLFGDLYAH